MLPEMDGSIKTPQISEMFSKFALAFKTKTIEFFAEDEEDDAFAAEESDPLLLLDSAEEVITGQRVVVIKPDSSQNKPTPIPKHLQQTLISSLFATVSSFEASYLQLQTAHSPFDADNIKAADKAAVSHLQKLSEIKQNYRDFRKNPNPKSSPKFPFGSQFEAQVQENQSILRTLEMLVNRLQLEIDLKDAEVLLMKQKLDKIENSNLRLSKRLLESKSSSSSSSSSSEVLLSVGLFDSILHDACKSTHRFSKLLIDLMEKVGWDLDLAANSVYPDVEYAKNGHNRYAFLSYVCLEMFRGFDLEGFGIEGDEIQCNGNDLNAEMKKIFLRQFVEHGTGDAVEILRKNPGGYFAKFCEKKYQQLIHPTMESFLFKTMDQNELVLNSWRSSASFYESFVDMASSIWMLHKLAFSFDPSVEIFQVERGVDFSMVYMENITRKRESAGKTRAKVGFTVIPGFKIGCTVIQCQVYLTGAKIRQ
ncbi:protein of unknown function DUF641 [Macleaya cordata]|uniref:Uncharacterized protein n=1 Tax=Macleaya cordata TaxID=56857 RepID=A0A200R839_MACCD|nr:protein of unknown function DUF641 [Macleaya cordata]